MGMSFDKLNMPVAFLILQSELVYQQCICVRIFNRVFIDFIDEGLIPNVSLYG